MTILEALLLGLVQGLTEFLPVSSSAHLLLAQSALGTNPPGVTLEIAVHLATLAGVLLYFRQDVGVTIRDTLLGGPGRRTGLMVIVGTLPVVIVGLLFKSAVEGFLEMPVVAAACLLVTGAFLLATRFARQGTEEPTAGESMRLALVVGCAQAFAILPGISRSGSTISAALLLGDKPEHAARFSFLLAIPAILGAGILHGTSAVSGESAGAPGVEIGTTALAVACIAAFASGLAAIHVLFTLVKKGRLALFGPYCILVGGAWSVWILAA